ncbi:hypothetical protein CBR_g50822 [Chara braunii]|uniref:Uncharacterized protein n=1 Tax=Chara braunii TaxID=69332 RepID=A0A388M7H5_CHABU|nr:hypothetical protein CBR_g50822 [Chara braunii]|eukprot:GBG90476.1 hypothetical protein CBR_g50822 [Chara braunii]
MNKSKSTGVAEPKAGVGGGKVVAGQQLRSHSNRLPPDVGTSSRVLAVPSDEMANLSMTRRIAIDLGTSSCRVAVCRDGEVDVIPDMSGERSTPSIVAFTGKKRLVGQQTRIQVKRGHENWLYGMKRLIGRDYDSIREEERKWWPFEIVKGSMGEAMVEVRSELLSSLRRNNGDHIQSNIVGQFQQNDARPVEAEDEPKATEAGVVYLAPEQILAMLLAKMRSDAERFLRCDDLHAAVITVPALFNDRQRSGIKQAAEIAGLTDVQLVSESTAAALSFAECAGLISSGWRGVSAGEPCPRGAKVLVFALGGGNFEVALVTIAGGHVIVDSVDGNPCLGGMDFDHKMMELILHRVKEQFHLAPEMQASTLKGLKSASEKAKEELTILQDAQVDLEFILSDNELKVTIQGAEFEKKCKSLVDECMDCVRRLLQESKTKSTDVKEAVFVGGSTRIPRIFETFKKSFSLEPKAHPYQDEAFVRGAALFGDWSQLVTETHATTIEYYNRWKKTYFFFQQRKRPGSYVLPDLSNWSRDPQDDQFCLELFESRGVKKEPLPVGKIVVRVGQHNDSPVLPLLTIDRCGILCLDEGQSSLPAVFHKSGQRSADEISGWKQFAEKLRVYERKVAEIRSAKNQWSTYIGEVHKRESLCPCWLWSTISAWKHEIERWLEMEMEAASGRVEIEQFTTQFDGFRRACQYAFGDTWARSIPGRRRFLVIDCWESHYIDECLQNLRANARPDLSDVVVCMPLKDLRKTKDRIIEGIKLAATDLSSNHSIATPATVKTSGIHYAVLSASPLSSSDDRAALCSEWRRLGGKKVSLAVQAGLQVVLRLEREDSPDEQSSTVPYDLDEENRRCEAQLKDLVKSIGWGSWCWQNITIAYFPPPNLCWTEGLPGQGASIWHQNEVHQHNDPVVVQTARHIRKVIEDEVNAEAAETTRILIGGGAAMEMWNALFKQEEVDGLLLEGGFRDPRLVGKLCPPSRERTGKVLLCHAASGPVTLDERNIRLLHGISSDLMDGEEVLWMTVRYATREKSGVHLEEGTGSVEMVWKGGAVVEESKYRPVVNNRRMVTIFPILECGDAGRLEDRIERQLSRWAEELKRADLQGREVVVEFRPAPSVAMQDRLPAAIETTHALIRRWILMKISPHVAQAVRIVCSVDGLPPETQRDIMRQPNVDGTTVRLDSAGNAPVSAESVPANEAQLDEMLTVRSARNQWKKYIYEVEKRESSCPRWLWSVISGWKLAMERWLGRKEVEGGCVDKEQFASRFAEFRRACEIAFGALWERSMSGRKFLIVDCWGGSSEISHCLQNLLESGGRDLCDVVISMPLKELRKTKERIARMEGIKLAAPSLSPKATPDALAKNGIPYVVLQAGPAVIGSGDRKHLCSGWNKIVGDQVSLAVQAGLHVVLRLGQDNCYDLEDGHEAFKLEEEKRHCEAQLRDIVSRIGKNFRNIAIAYLPPAHVLLPDATTEAATQATTEATTEAATEAATEAGATRLRQYVIETVRHIRHVIKDLMSAEAADAANLLIGRCGKVDTWDTFINPQHEIDGLLLETGLRDPLFFDKLLRKGGPSEKIRLERRGKVLLCAGQEENATLNKYDLIRLSAVTEKLLGAEEVVWITTKYVPTLAVRSGTSMIREINGSYALLWKEGHVITDYSEEVNAVFKVKIVPIFSSHKDSHGQEVAEALSTQLSELRKNLMGKTDSDWSGLLLEYRPADSLDTADSIVEAVEGAQSHIRGWLLVNFGAEAAQEVRIVCFFEEELDSETRRRIANLPNVDGVSLRLSHRRTTSRTGLAA